MKRNLTAAGVSAKWAAGLATAAAPGGAVEAGIKGVTTSPGQSAANASAAWVQGVQNAVTKWKTRVAAVDLATWQNTTIAKGVTQGRIASGAQVAGAAGGKFQVFMGDLLTYEQNLINQLNQSNPRGSTAANITRATVWMQGMTNFKSQYPGPF